MDQNTAENTGTAPEEITTEPSQETEAAENPLETELKRETGRQRTPEEKAAYALRKNAESVAALGLDPLEVLGLNNKAPQGFDTLDKDAPVTVGMLEAMRQEQAQKTALQLADEIADPHERELTKKYLVERVKPSGDAHEDLRFARLAVNSVKNTQVVEELNRAGTARSFGSGAGAPPGTTQKEPEFTELEKSYMKPPFNLTKEQVLAARPKA